MLLTITYSTPPATDLGYLLHEHPQRVQTFELSFGAAHVFYPQANEARCTAALLLDVDPVGLVRGRKGPPGDRFSLARYVSDRPYVASSLLSVAIAQVYGSALGGRCAQRPELPDNVAPLRARIALLPCRGGDAVLRDRFEPLGYDVEAERHAFDPAFPDWGDSVYFTVTLQNTCTLQALLTHLYVLIPVLDNDKHSWVGDDEAEKLRRRGEGWLSAHPACEAITSRHLKHQRSLTRTAIARLAEEDEPDPNMAAIVEVIEHLDPPRLAAFERVVFEHARPRTVVLTTPNAEYNVKWKSLPARRFRHRDHRFEWTRAEFQTWANCVAGQHGYGVRFLPIGPEDDVVGAPTQMGVFDRG